LKSTNHQTIQQAIRVAILAFLSQKPQIWLFLKVFGLRIFFRLFLAFLSFKSDIVYQSEFSDEISLFD